MSPRLRSLFQKHPRRGANSLEMRRRLSFETLEQRMLLTATLLNTPVWRELGPGPITHAGNVDLDGNGNPTGGDLADVQTGAIEAIAVDPANIDHVFVGTINGGVWETNDATKPSPLWTTTTDQLPSLAISAIAISPTNANVVYAGTGSYSSFNSVGGQGVGLYKTVDGGANWTHLGFSTFNGMRIRSVIPTIGNNGATVFVATTDTLGTDTGGIYRSDNAGDTWTRLSGRNGLPNAGVSHLASFPIDNTRIGFYASVVTGPGVGLYRSVDSGQSWQLITNNIAPSVGNAIRIEFSVSAAQTAPVYVGLIDANKNLINVFRSTEGADGIDNNGTGGVDEPAEVFWRAISNTPPVLGGQGHIHFSILADKDDGNIVYIGGAGSPTKRGNLFRGNSSTRTWTALSQPGAGNTAPHPDSRDMVFAGNDILQADDGGIYRLVNPRGLGTATAWESALGDLGNAELFSVALDNRNNSLPTDDVILAGAMDNGSSERSASGSWAQTLAGDGMVVQATNILTPVHYFSSQHFGSFVKRVGGARVVGVPRRVEEAPPDTVLSPQFDQSMVSIFEVQYQLHATNPNRILVGSKERLYESFDGGDSFFSIGRVFDGRPLPVPNLTGTVVSLAYGSAANVDVAYVGTDTGDIFIRKELGIFGDPFPLGEFTRTNFFIADGIDLPAADDDPMDIVSDPQNPMRAFAVTTSAVFMTVNGMDWTRITDDLLKLALPGSNVDLQSIELVNDDTPDFQDDVILVGGLGGVFRRRAVAVAGPKWSEYGAGLPNVLVTDMEYDRPSDTLLVGTFGRGAWSVPQVRSTIGLESRLQIDGTAGADAIRLVRKASNPSLLDVFFNNRTSTPSLTAQLSVVQRIQINGAGGPDVLEIQSSGGIVSVQNGIDFLGGNDQFPDTLVLRNTTDTQNTTGEFVGGGIKSPLTGPLTFSGVEAISIFFGSGSDSFNGSATSIPFKLVGGPGIDILTGGMGGDTFDSRDGLGNDVLFGGPGNDVAAIDAGDFFDGGPNQLPSADFEMDGDVDGADFLAWQRGVGASGPNVRKANGDADNDFDVDAADLSVWRTNFGINISIASAGSAASSAKAMGLRLDENSPPELGWLVGLVNDSVFGASEGSDMNVVRDRVARRQVPGSPVPQYSALAFSDRRSNLPEGDARGSQNWHGDVTRVTEFNSDLNLDGLSEHTLESVYERWI